MYGTLYSRILKLNSLSFYKHDACKEDKKFAVGKKMLRFDVFRKNSKDDAFIIK